MTELLYQTDSYLQEFSAEVLAVDEANHGVVLSRTAFYLAAADSPRIPDP
jgi:Ser-tRNA(Ala) deacylase AlaX